MTGYTYEKDLSNNRFVQRQMGAPSLNPPLNINSSLFPIDREEANAELERGEYVLSKKDGSLKKVLGTPHYQEGTPALLSTGDFIFSKHSSMGVKKEDGDILNLSKLSSVKSKNTPANILKKNIDVPHHNKMVALLQDPLKGDALSVNSAQQMVDKNMKKLEKIAALQENTKGRLEELPNFSLESLPTFKTGGKFLPKYQNAGRFTEEEKKKAVKRDSPSKGFKLVHTEGNKNYFKKEGSTGQSYYVEKGNITPMTVEDILTNPKYKTFNRANAGAPPEWRRKSAEILHNTGRMRFWADEPQYEYTESSSTPSVGEKVGQIAVTGGKSSGTSTTTPSSIGNVVGQIAGVYANSGVPQKKDDTPSPPSIGYSEKIPLTPEQKLGVANGIYNALQVKRFNPIRPYVEFTPLVSETINPQIYRNNVKSQFSQMVNANQASNPILARINNAQHFGTSLDNLNKMEAEAYNQNIGIANQTAQYNNQGINNTHFKNVELGKKYYDETVLSNQNFLRENQIARNQILKDFLQYKGDNLALKMYEASLPRGSRTIYVNPNTNETSYFPKPGYEKRTENLPIYSYDLNNGGLTFNNVGIPINQGATSPELDYSKWKKQMVDAGVNPSELTFATYIQWRRTEKT